LGKIIDKVMEVLVGPNYEEDDYTEAQPNMVERNAKTEDLGISQKGAVLSLHTAKQFRVVVSEPTSFDDSQGIAEHLKSRRQVIINMEATDKEVAQRILDFISGACYALDGRVQKIGEGVFLFAPHNVDITSEVKETGWQQSALPWMGQVRDKRI
jgi:cell division inhibitor SepF